MFFLSFPFCTVMEHISSKFSISVLSILFPLHPQVDLHQKIITIACQNGTGQISCSLPALWDFISVDGPQKWFDRCTKIHSSINQHVVRILAT